MSNGKYVEEKLIFIIYLDTILLFLSFFFNFALHVYFVHNFLPFLIVLINNSLQQGIVTSDDYINVSKKRFLRPILKTTLNGIKCLPCF